MNGLVAIVGPTAIGKTEIALQLAEHFKGEIVNADSRQIYKYMDIGTAKPGERERAKIAHHIIDIIDPDEPFSLATYLEMAKNSINNIHLRDSVPFLVGGSGLYVWSVVEGWKIPEVPPNIQFREELEKLADRQGSHVLFEELNKVDPNAAQKIAPSNVRRIIRALEIYRTTGHPASQQWGKQLPSFKTVIVGLSTDRASLYESIDRRVDWMIQNGLIDEVKRLKDMGYGSHLASMSGIGYRQIYSHIQGDMGLKEAIQDIKYETHRLVRRQYAWFRKGDTRINWYDVKEDAYSCITQLLERFIYVEKY
jgi:tRNA dimethylallyltransferase